jgi:hypothetical protein
MPDGDLTLIAHPDPVTRRRVEAMAAYGIRESDIARVVQTDLETLRMLYRDELDTGSVKANSRVAENLYRKATGDGREAVIAAIFWLKTRAKWSEASAPSEHHLSHEEALELLA